MRAMLMAGAIVALAGCASANQAALTEAAASYCLLSAQEDGAALAQFNPRTGEQHLYPIGSMPHEIEVSPDSVFAYVSQFGMRDFSHETGTAGDHVTEINLVSGATRNFMLPDGLRGPHGVRLHGGEVFTNAEVGDRMVVFDAASGAVRRTFAIPRNIHHFIFSQDAASLFAFALADGIYKLDARDGRVLAHVAFDSPARSVVLAHGGRDVLVAVRGEVVFLSATDLSVVRRFPVQNVTQLIYATIDEERGLLFAPAPGENVVVVLDLETGAERARVALGRRPIIAIPDGDGRAYISNVNDTFITAVDLRTFGTSRLGTFQRPNGLALGACRG